MNSTLVNQVEKFCIEKYTQLRYIEHITYVVNNSYKLLKYYQNADADVVILASFLHDITKEYDRDNHHESGAKVAELFLKSINYEELKIERVKYAIRGHRGSQIIPRLTIEDEIVANADAMAVFQNPLTLFFSTFRRIEDFELGKKRILEKIQTSYNKITLPEAKDLIEDSYKYILSMVLGLV